MQTTYAIITLLGIIGMVVGLVITAVSAILRRGPLRPRWGIAIFVLSILVFLAFMIAAAEEKRQLEMSALLVYTDLLG